LRSCVGERLATGWDREAVQAVFMRARYAWAARHRARGGGGHGVDAVVSGSITVRGRRTR